MSHFVDQSLYDMLRSAKIAFKIAEICTVFQHLFLLLHHAKSKINLERISQQRLVWVAKTTTIKEATAQQHNKNNNNKIFKKSTTTATKL